MKKPLAQLLDKLIEAAPEKDKGAISIQLQIGGQPYAGSVMHSKDHDGLYEMIVIHMQTKMAVSVYFEGKDVTAVFVPREMSPIVQPKSSGLII